MFDFWRALAASAALLVGGIPAAAAGPAKPAAAKVAQDYEPRPALWLLADEDTKIYLFGTVHMLPPGFRWVSPAVEKTIKEADELVVETYDAPGTTENDDAHSEMYLDRPVPILERVPKKHRRALKSVIRETGLPANSFDRLQTWAAGMLLSVALLMKGYGEEAGAARGVEDLLEERFRAAGKPILSVEDPLDVVRSMNAIPAEKQVELLVTGLDDFASATAEASDADRDWATGDADSIGASMEKEIPPVLYEPLLTQRNAKWTDWLQKRLERPGTVLFAVGAGHLAGRDSVQKMLAARGLEAKRID